MDSRDTGIDLVAKTSAGEYHAIQCKLYAEDYRLQKSDIDSFFTASGKKVLTHRIIVSTTNHWSEHAEDALRDHQKYALDAVTRGLANTDRGKLIMACGTGKTFTSLKIAEALAGAGKHVLFLVPSLNLLSQTLTEWTQESDTPLHSFAVCSDSDVGKKRKKDDDTVQTFTHELRYPATTEPARLATEMSKRHDAQHMSVVFSTYHSIDVISRAQHDFNLADFDLIICDEAHRTTGATFDSEDESAFVKVHDSDYIRSAKRLYMTTTPRIYGEVAKASAEKDNVALCSMDDETLYGKELYVITFSEAVRRSLLVDYKVIVLAVEETHINRRLQNLLKDENNQLKVDDAAKIIGCWKALSKQGLTDDLSGDGQAMQRAAAFCQVIELAKGGKTHKVSSKQIAGMFQAVVEAYQETEEFEQITRLNCEAEHVDGSMNASEKETKLDWLKAEVAENTCRILSNVRCLSEGVDVPALDAVLFLTPRNSQVDVVQSVGRVMRTAPGKKRGYVILPVVIPAGVEPHEALNDNQTYKVVWQVLQALRSHDDRFDAMVNKLDLIGRDTSKMEVIAITDKIQKKRDKPKGKTNAQAGKGGHAIGQPKAVYAAKPEQQDLQFEIGEIERAIYAKLVQKVGNRHHWEDWANDIAKIARTHIDRITAILENPVNAKEQAAFTAFAAELRDDLNNSISDAEIIEMLAQHLITKPVFDALFEDYSFAQHNPMSLAMQAVLDILQEHNLNKEADTLQAFYASVKLRAEGIESATGKQKIVVELYDKFFRNAFPKMTERLGIVYTPVEVVDFIIHSINHILQTEFGQTLGSPGVHILDPFAGTGTFITRPLQSGLITQEELPYKYQHEIHANEIVLLAYYIAAINIEAVYHSIMNTPQPEGALPHRHSGLDPESSHGNKGAQSAPLDTGLRRYDVHPYQPFEGICLTDTFQMYEKEDLVDQLLEHNSARRKRQKKLDIRVIMGNPPYSTGQGSANDNNQNVAYPHLDSRIRTTYAERSTATNKNALYDSYIRAIRWASDRIGDSGVIGFISGSGFAEKLATDGLRKCLADEFSNIHVLNLRGDIRKNMLSKGRAKEGQNIFGSGSMTGIAITLFIKNPDTKRHGQIYYHDIGNGLTREEKLEKISTFASIAGITEANGWQAITPDAHGDWLKQRDDHFGEYIVLGDKKGDAPKLFENYSCGVQTNRDVWCYNASKASVTANMKRMIAFYNSEVTRFANAFGEVDKKVWEAKINNFINTDPTQISWSSSLTADLTRLKSGSYKDTALATSLYRPFTKQWFYFDRMFNHRPYQMPRIFPILATENLVICVSGIGARSGFSALMADALPNLHTLDTGQCFPLYLYDPVVPAQAGTQPMLDWGEAKPLDSRLRGNDGYVRGNDGDMSGDDGYVRRDALTDEGLVHFQSAYPVDPVYPISKEDAFYYVYGLLHSKDYRERYADNLSKELPRIPRVKTAAGFWAFSQAGRKLAELHLNYETVPIYQGAKVLDAGGKVFNLGDPKPLDSRLRGNDDDGRGNDERESFWRVEKMKVPKTDGKKDLTRLIYNAHITVSGIPPEAYDYVVNGKPALDWVVERQCVKTDKDSGIVNDANDWAIETMGNPRYPLELFMRVVTVSLETMKIVNGLPPLEIASD